MNIRRIIREAIEAFLEMREKPHFGERVYDRLDSDDTNFKYEKDAIKKIVYDNIDFLRKLNINTLDNIGVLIFKSPNKYVYHRELPGGEVEHSEGKFIWAIVRANELETIVFGDADYKPRNTQVHLTVDRLRDYVYTEKGGNLDLTEKDIRKLTTIRKKEKAEEKPQEIIINIKGVKWIIDPKTEEIIKKNNPSIRYSVWDVLENKVDEMQLEEPAKEEIMSYLF